MCRGSRTRWRGCCGDSAGLSARHPSVSALDALLDDPLAATFNGNTSTKPEWIAALDRLLPALVRNDIRDIVVTADRACVLYDFVTDTPVDAILCVENLIVTDNRITSIELLLDLEAFGPVRVALAERAGR
jgi:hypothetical protein